MSNIMFEFGDNWQDYLKRCLNEDSIKEAQRSITEFLGINNLTGKTFMDIGCGSGIFSYAAYNLSAKHIISFDIDQKSVQCCEHLHKQAGSPSSWSIYTGSVLDDNFLANLPKTDIVYSWGVLHHTGRMWQAIRNAASLILPDGLLYISIYNKIEHNFLQQYRGSHFWRRVKKTYNNSGKEFKKLMEWSYMSAYILKKLLTLENPLNPIRSYQKNRGMNWRVDITDKLGGYPYEFATAEEIFRFCKNELHLDLINIKLTTSLGCNQYLFKMV